MSAASVASKIHKWLALVVAIPILFWFASGLFFAAVPIERVRSEHVLADTPEPPVPLALAGDGLRRLAAAGVGEGDRIEIRSLYGRPVALVTNGEQPPRLHDLVSGRPVSPISAASAAAIAERALAGGQRALRVTLVSEESPEYRGMLPAWRVDFAQADRAVYVSVDTGAVTARRSALWRAYDFLWGLHILDLREHEDFNTPLLIVASALALVVLVSGIVMFPSRLGFGAWRRRRQRRLADARNVPATPSEV